MWNDLNLVPALNGRNRELSGRGLVLASIGLSRAWNDRNRAWNDRSRALSGPRHEWNGQSRGSSDRHLLPGSNDLLPRRGLNDLRLLLGLNDLRLRRGRSDLPRGPAWNVRPPGLPRVRPAATRLAAGAAVGIATRPIG